MTKHMTDIRKDTDKELEKRLAEARAKVRAFRFDVTGSKAKNVKDGANAKKVVARILTELRSRKSGTALPETAK
jgi:ribosomal protein L29